MHVIATAGHVDHGKSALVEALTGTNPDRLIEEQKRAMTIDLGFAWMTLPDGKEVGIIDVPGHKDFISNMLAGVAGIDAIVLIIAADEGVMPQTLEHLQIIDLLRIQNGIIALTKIDLVQDTEWLKLIENDIKNLLKNTVLEKFPVVRISAKTGEGLDKFIETLSEILEKTPEKKDIQKPRLPIDRVFTLQGFGTIVTGTLLNGSLRVGDNIRIEPSEITSRIRGLQTHKRKEQIAVAGSRTAVNMVGVDVSQLKRGDVLVLPGQYNPTWRFDARIQILKSYHRSIKHNDSIKIFVGTSERIGKIRLLKEKELLPGNIGFVQIELDQNVLVEKNDLFIIRIPSPSETIGGGEILDAHPIGRYRLNDELIISRLSRVNNGSEKELVLSSIPASEFINVKDIKVFEPHNHARLLAALLELETEREIVILPNLYSGIDFETIVCNTQTWENIVRKLYSLLNDIHKNKPLSVGLSMARIPGLLNLPVNYVKLILTRLTFDQHIKVVNDFVALVSHEIKLNSNQLKRKNNILEQFKAHPFNPPGYELVIDILGEDLFESFIQTGDLVKISTDIIFSKAEYSEMKDFVVNTIKNKEPLTVILFRDHFKTSRKYAVSFLEYLDSQKITRREVEGRVLF